MTEPTRTDPRRPNDSRASRDRPGVGRADCQEGRKALSRDTLSPLVIAGSVPLVLLVFGIALSDHLGQMATVSFRGYRRAGWPRMMFDPA